jgi:hypothetical protein
MVMTWDSFRNVNMSIVIAAKPAVELSNLTNAMVLPSLPS